jgi:8-oxo-dGTP diphosphatase
MGIPGDGNGWVRCAQGHRHWGLFGAAGLLVHHTDGGGRAAVLLQHRASWSHHGGTWGILGGARDSGESVTATALREASEEAALEQGSVRAHAVFRDDHGGWSYDTVIAEAHRPVPTEPVGDETDELRWVPIDDVLGMPLHPGFRQTWPRLRDALVNLTVVVDAANVVGSRPDGWWRDRVGATARLAGELAALAGAGLPNSSLPGTLSRPDVGTWLPEIVLVVEGEARAVLTSHGGDGPELNGHVHLVPADGSGDDALVEVVQARRVGRPPAPVLVVTADRELRARCAVHGASVVGPGWLVRLLQGAHR